MYIPVEMTLKQWGLAELQDDMTINSEETPDIVIPPSIQAFI